MSTDERAIHTADILSLLDDETEDIIVSDHLI